MNEEKKKEILSKIIKNSGSDVGEDIKNDHMAMPTYEEQEVIYPQLYLSSDQLRVLTDYELGDDVFLVAKGKVKYIHSRETEEEGKKENYEVEIQTIGCPKKDELDEDLE